MPTFVQRLQFTVKDHTVGKAATFTKVDNVIQETKNLMNVISKVVTTCFECATKVSYLFNIVVNHNCDTIEVTIHCHSCFVLFLNQIHYFCISIAPYE